MLRRVNPALFEAPRGARVQVVVESQGNNGVNDATFEYGGDRLPRETILGLPGCSFTVAGARRLEAGVVFDPGAPGSARYDMFEVENGVRSDLNKSVEHSRSAPLIAFTIDPVAAATRGAVSFAARAAAPRMPRKGDVTAPRRKPAKKKAKTPDRQTAGGRKKVAPKKATRSRRKTRTPSRKELK